MSTANLAVMHRDVAARWGPKSALRFRRHGVYLDLSWSDYRRQCDAAAAGLLDLGLKIGDRVALFSDNRPEWLLADVALLSAGLVNVPLHASLVPMQAAYQIQHSQARGIIVDGPVRLDRIRSVLAALPQIEFIVAFDPVHWHAPLPCLSWEGLKQKGIHHLRRRPSHVRERMEALTRDDLATIIYTSGTTGVPKGVMLTHGNLLANAQAMREQSDLEPDDLLLSWLPYSHIYARTCDHYTTMMTGCTVALADHMDTVVRQLSEVQPTWMTAVPRFYEKIWNLVAPLPIPDRADQLQNIFGRRIKWLTSGGAPLDPNIAEGFHEAGLLLLQGYGLTEASPVISFNSRKEYRLASVGAVLPGVEVVIAEDGEILTRGPHVMKGYWQDPDATREVIDDDGWLHTGDVGYLDEDGFLFITDRKKDIIVTAGGKNIAPAELERLLVADPHIDHAIIFGDAKPYVSALIVPQPQLLEAKAKELGCTVEKKGELITAPALVGFFLKRVEHLMQAVSQPERVKKILLLGRSLSLDQEELTPKLSVRRKAIIHKFLDEFERLYEKD